MDPPIPRLQNAIICLVSPCMWKTSVRVAGVAEPGLPLLERIRGGPDLVRIARELIPSDEREHFLVFLLDGRNGIKAYA